MYPTVVPPEVQEKLSKDKEAKNDEEEKLPLNCLPGLKRKTDKQRFIIKVYAILTIMLFITFGLTLVTMKSEGKIS